LLEQNSRL